LHATSATRGSASSGHLLLSLLEAPSWCYHGGGGGGGGGGSNDNSSTPVHSNATAPLCGDPTIYLRSDLPLIYPLTAHVLDTVLLLVLGAFAALDAGAVGMTSFWSNRWNRTFVVCLALHLLGAVLYFAVGEQSWVWASRSCLRPLIFLASAPACRVLVVAVGKLCVLLLPEVCLSGSVSHCAVHRLLRRADHEHSRRQVRRQLF
jgi:hypothetical protein